MMFAFRPVVPPDSTCTKPAEVIGAPLVIFPALVSLTVPALMVPVPVVFTVEDVPVLEMVTPWAAVMVGELLVVKAFDATVDRKATDPLSDLTFALTAIDPPR
jgi:hypothetical protein